MFMDFCLVLTYFLIFVHIFKVPNSTVPFVLNITATAMFSRGATWILVAFAVVATADSAFLPHSDFPNQRGRPRVKRSLLSEEESGEDAEPQGPNSILMAYVVARDGN